MQATTALHFTWTILNGMQFTHNKMFKHKLFESQMIFSEPILQLFLWPNEGLLCTTTWLGMYFRLPHPPFFVTPVTWVDWDISIWLTWCIVISIWILLLIFDDIPLKQISFESSSLASPHTAIIIAMSLCAVFIRCGTVQHAHLSQPNYILRQRSTVLSKHNILEFVQMLLVLDQIIFVCLMRIKFILSFSVFGMNAVMSLLCSLNCLHWVHDLINFILQHWSQVCRNVIPTNLCDFGSGFSHLIPSMLHLSNTHI